MKKAAIVAIVGRANVGKSSLFNSVLKRREAIVANEPGTTRDAISARASWHGHDFWLVDTAGIKDPEDDFEFTIQEQIAQAADSADIIWVVIEADAPITEEDRKVAKMALKTKKPVYLLVNKADKVRGAKIDDYRKTGITEIFLTSATQNRGISAVLDQLVTDVPKANIKTDPNQVAVALLGRPNVGKSYLFNSLGKKQQAIVSDVAGTTRDINRVDVRYEKQTIELMDTAGIRRSGKIGQGIERFSVIRSISAIEQADVCLLLMDVNEFGTALDQKIAGMIKEAGKGLVLVISKWDSVDDKDAFTHDQLAARIKHTFDFVPWAPLIFTSSVTGQNVTKLFDIVLEIHQARQTKITTPLINRWLKKVTNTHPPAGLKNTTPKLQYIVQEADNPTNFKVYGSDTKFLHWSYKRFMERKLREAYGFDGTPVRFWFFDKR
ncbi:ribosome biogenesis GTPase Der [Candidatus Saccharibacteria bacterium]|nr:ribosome biogenesis GTPase Der [Candidatus Saccharibacteria bacterium]